MDVVGIIATAIITVSSFGFVIVLIYMTCQVVREDKRRERARELRNTRSRAETQFWQTCYQLPRGERTFLEQEWRRATKLD